MSLPAPDNFGDYLVFVDESGDHGLARVYLELSNRGQAGRITHVIVEKRGEKEDNQLELAFRRIVAGANALNQRLPFEVVMIPKASSSTGLQMADLVARAVYQKALAHELRDAAGDSGEFYNP